jgi:hypothetical protein
LHSPVSLSMKLDRPQPAQKVVHIFSNLSEVKYDAGIIFG